MTECNKNMTFSTLDVVSRNPTEDDIDELETNFDKNCEWVEDYIGSIRDDYVENLKIITFNGKILGVYEIYNPMETFDGLDIYYVSTECTRDKERQLDDPYFTTHEGSFVKPGRILWAYILNEIYNLNERRPFIVYNHAIPISYGYHIAMGMKPISQLQLNGRDVTSEMKELFVNNSDLNASELSERAIYSDEFDETYLFYISDENINYDCIEDILKSLPKSEKIKSVDVAPTRKRENEQIDENLENDTGSKRRRIFGGKTKKNKNKNKTKKKTKKYNLRKTMKKNKLKNKKQKKYISRKNKK